MTLEVNPGKWDAFLRKYRQTENQWYLIPKAKTFTEESVAQIITGLGILRRWFSETEDLPAKDQEYLRRFLYDPQRAFHEEGQLVFTWGRAAQVFLTTQLFGANVISRDQQDEALRACFDEIISLVQKGTRYTTLLRRFGTRIGDFTANSRNFINICQKLGLAWIEQNHSVAITSVGNALVDRPSQWRALLEHQLRRLQFYNPTFDRVQSRYGDIRVFPFNFCLQVIVNVVPHEISLNEFALFITKAVSMEEVESCIAWIDAFRSLSAEERDAFLDRVQRDQHCRRRSLFTECLETSRKNINLFTLCGPWERADIGGADGIALTDIQKAREILRADRSLQFVEFESREAWLSEYGNIDSKFDVDTAIDYYTRIGRLEKARGIVERAVDRTHAQERLSDRLQEKWIENFYREHLDLIERGLRLVTLGGKSGQQFETPDAGTIDLLTQDAGGAFVVIEFKRDKASDEVVGQILRYLGWVRKNLSRDRVVRGYIVAYDFEKFIHYALRGMQHPMLPNPNGRDLIRLFQHTFDVSHMGAVDLECAD